MLWSWGKGLGPCPSLLVLAGQVTGAFGLLFELAPLTSLQLLQTWTSWSVSEHSGGPMGSRPISCPSSQVRSILGLVSAADARGPPGLPLCSQCWAVHLRPLHLLQPLAGLCAIVSALCLNSPHTLSFLHSWRVLLGTLCGVVPLLPPSWEGRHNPFGFGIPKFWRFLIPPLVFQPGLDGSLHVLKAKSSPLTLSPLPSSLPSPPSAQRGLSFPY